MPKVNISARSRMAMPYVKHWRYCKDFPIRQCENSVYRNRSRPCLQYQIGRCLGPCVEGLVSEEEYAQQVEYVRLFCLAKMIRCLRNSLVVWKLPARI